MTYVLDSSVAVKWAIYENDSAISLQVRNDWQKKLINLLAPDFFPLEVLHALTRAERQGRIQVGQAIVLWKDIMVYCPLLEFSLPLVPRACDISSKARIGSYDCLYVALAEQENCELITADDRLIRNLKPQFPFIIALADYP